MGPTFVVPPLSFFQNDVLGGFRLDEDCCLCYGPPPPLSGGFFLFLGFLLPPGILDSLVVECRPPFPELLVFF